MKRMKIENCVSTPSPSLLCSICKDLFYFPVISTTCYHSFCSSCIKESLSFDSQCPLCRNILCLKDFHSNLALVGLISELLVFCPYSSAGCNAQMFLDTVESHLKSDCNHVPKKCIYSKYGCDDYITQSNDHLNTCAYHAINGFIKKCDERISKLESIIADQQLKIELILECRNTEKNGLDELMNDFGINSDKNLIFNSLPNWLEGEITCCKTITTEKSGISSLIYRNNGLLYAGSYDGSIKVLVSSTGNLQSSFIGHRLSVWALVVDENKRRLYSGCSDESINVWDMDTGLIIATFLTSGKIYSLVLTGNKLISGHSDGKIRIWDTEKLEIVDTIASHSAGINSLKLYGNTLFSASSDKTVKVAVLIYIWCGI